ncbi:MAG: LysR family transcriptional regulator [Hyphomicrobiaceae bacterium]|nr:LysR family transcriptional regulator [Hyphomicrobiaceae bacterium]
MDRLQAMSVFVAVAEQAGFAAAARRLNISPPSATRAVSDLEGRLGARLLHRTTRSVTLTEAGERYLEDCRRILAEVDAADRHAAGIHAEPRGLVTVTGSVVFGRQVITPILLELTDQYPDISISTLFVDRVVHLVDEGIDVAVRIAELPDSSLRAVRVGSVRRVLCSSPGYLEARGRPEKPSDLHDHDLLDFVNLARGRDWVFHHGDTTQAMRVSSRLRFNVADAAIAAALQDGGITRVLSYMIAPHVKSGALELLLEDYEPPPIPVHVVHKEAGQTSARVRAVVDFLAARLRKSSVLHTASPAQEHQG